MWTLEVVVMLKRLLCVSTEKKVNLKPQSTFGDYFCLDWKCLNISSEIYGLLATQL